ncbi:MAG: diaminopimelate decarboxylase [Dehalococcoidia bacterium]|nr:diaminopimelate decarboxylase [Dehalococcoidia bacterium]
MFPQRVFPETTEVNSRGHLAIGGCDVLDLASQFGTPLYVFDEDMLRNRCRQFVQEFRSRHQETTVVYACKAYVNPALARIFKEEGLGLDVVSGGELAVAKAVDFPPEMVYFHGNNKGRDELRESLEWNIGLVVVDSFHELELLDRLANEAGKVQEILIRVSPGVDPHTHVHTTTGILDSKFGFPIQTGQAEEAILQALRSSNLKLLGLHFHLGSPIFELEPYKVAMELVLNFASQFREEGLILQEISPGGGFAIAYTRDQEPPPVGDYAEAIVSTMLDTCRTLGMEAPRLVVEPGRAIVGPAGVALYRVGAVKDIPGVRKYVSVDGGMGDNIRPALYDAAYEAVVAGKMRMEPSDKVTIAGKYCESGDVLVRDITLPPVEADDVIAIPAAGAYCLAMSSTYNLNPRPPIVLVKAGEARLIRRREGYQDMMLCDVI